MEPERLEEIIARAQAKEAWGYEQLLEAFGPRLYSYFLRATGSHSDSEDLLGEMMLRLMRMLEKYDHRGRFEQWLFRIASNMIRDRVRRRQASPVTAFGTAGSDEPTREEELAAPAAPVEAALVAAETALELQEAMARLEPTTRDMILLRHFGEMSFREIAELYGCPLGTVLARVHRGLKALRKLMGDDDDR